MRGFLFICLYFTIKASQCQFVPENENINPCQLRPDRRRCSTQFVPRWYFNPFKGECYIFRYGGCGGNGNNFLSRSMCQQKCSPPKPIVLKKQRSQDKFLENYVEKCKAPADSGPCRARLSMWSYDPGKRKCYTFFYGGCGGNSNRYATEEDCLKTCVSKNSPNYVTNQAVQVIPKTKPIKKQQQYNRRNKAMYRSFFPLIWQINIKKNSEINEKPIDNKMVNNGYIKTTTGATVEISTPIITNIEKKTDATEKIDVTDDSLYSTTPPAQLQDEIENEEDIEVQDRNELDDHSEDFDNIENDESARDEDSDGEVKPDDHQSDWKTDKEIDESFEEDEGEISQQVAIEKESSNNISNEDEIQSEDTMDLPVDKLDSDTEIKETVDKTLAFDKSNDKAKLPRVTVIRSPPMKLFFKSQFSSKSKPYKRFSRYQNRNKFYKNNYRSNYGPFWTSTLFNKRNPSRYNGFYRNDAMNTKSMWFKNGKSPKRGITFTQVFVNKSPSSLPQTNRLNYQQFNGYHSNFGLQRYQQPTTYQENLLKPSIVGNTFAGLLSAGQSTFENSRLSNLISNYLRLPVSELVRSSQISEPNLACIHRVSVQPCTYGLLSSPFWYFDALYGECKLFLYRGCSASANNFGSKLECESTCLVTSPKPLTTKEPEYIESTTNLEYDSSETTTAVDDSLFEKEIVDTQRINQKYDKVLKDNSANGLSNDPQNLKVNEASSIEIVERSNEAEYIMVIGIVCLSGIALLILVSIGLMYVFKRFKNDVNKANGKQKKDTIIEAVLKAHIQGNLPKIVTPIPLQAPVHTNI